jgi:thiamine pyrophosphokinase
VTPSTLPGAVVSGKGPVTLVGGGPLGAEDLRDALALAPALVAADGGAGACLRAGLEPLAVIGDMDSLAPEAARALAGHLYPVPEQDSTDFDKALSRIDAPLVVGLGFAGGRLDHELAALHALVVRADRPCLVVGPETLVLHCPPALLLPLEVGATVSLFPLLPVRVASTGLRWGTDGLLLSPRGRIGTSNRATGPVGLRPRARGLLVILPRATLPLAAEALLAAPRWPARAR